ncbi:MAG: class F sortase [bacterium]|nr:class F sortase [bacterium]
MNFPKILLTRRILVLVSLAGLLLSLELIFHAILKSSIQSDLIPLTAGTTAFNEQGKMNLGLPVRLKIPRINVDATVEYVGLTPDGAMDIPKTASNVAWFNPGSRPGENGSAVLAGHYGWKNGKASAFDNLYKLRKGDKLYVEDDKGVTTSFVMRESRRYDPEADASGVFISNDGKSHLNLITCEGVWDNVSKSYSKRLVIFADKE